MFIKLEKIVKQAHRSSLRNVYVARCSIWCLREISITQMLLSYFSPRVAGWARSQSRGVHKSCALLLSYPKTKRETAVVHTDSESKNSCKKGLIIVGPGWIALAPFWVPDDIESCKFQNLLIFGFPETSQNLMSFRQLLFSLFHGAKMIWSF